VKKTSLAVLGMLVLSSSSFAANFLSGETFSRTFKSKPLNAPHEIEFTHHLIFGEDWTVVDNTNTFFGNPPEKCNYGIQWAQKAEHKALAVVVICRGSATIYKYTDKEGNVELVNGKVVLKKAQKKDEL